MFEVTKTKDKMVITVDLKEENWKPSRSGKTEVITTGGNLPVKGTDIKIGLNVMRARSN